MNKLEHTRLRGNLREVYNIMKDIERINRHDLFFRIGESKMREHVFKVREEVLKAYLVDWILTENGEYPKFQ